jgi:hypothetical protein
MMMRTIIQTDSATSTGISSHLSMLILAITPQKADARETTVIRNTRAAFIPTSCLLDYTRHRVEHDEAEDMDGNRQYGQTSRHSIWLEKRAVEKPAHVSAKEFVQRV